MIVKNHYSHKWTSCRYALGIFYETDNEHSFFDEKDEKLAGVAIYGYPVGRSAPKSISHELKEEEVLELTRLFIFDDYGKNTESVVLSKTFNWLKEKASEIKVLVSYSDPEQGHLGIIYQATNWIYQGNNIRLMPNYAIKLTEDGKLKPMNVKEGDKILFGKWSGTEVKLDGQDLLIMKESDIMGILE